MSSSVQCYSSKSYTATQSGTLVYNMELLFDQLDLNKCEGTSKNVISKQHVHNDKNYPQIITSTSYVIAADQNSSASSLLLGTSFDTDVDVVRYLTILNYANDFKMCVLSMNFDEYQGGQHIFSNTTTKNNIEDIEGCWKVYDHNGKCFCC